LKILFEDRLTFYRAPERDIVIANLSVCLSVGHMLVS